VRQSSLWNPERRTTRSGAATATSGVLTLASRPRFSRPWVTDRAWSTSVLEPAPTSPGSQGHRRRTICTDDRPATAGCGAGHPSGRGGHTAWRPNGGRRDGGADHAALAGRRAGCGRAHSGLPPAGTSRGLRHPSSPLRSRSCSSFSRAQGQRRYRCHGTAPTGSWLRSGRDPRRISTRASAPPHRPGISWLPKRSTAPSIIFGTIWQPVRGTSATGRSAADENSTSDYDWCAPTLASALTQSIIDCRRHQALRSARFRCSRGSLRTPGWVAPESAAFLDCLPADRHRGR
jgi:hypothetical protein